MIDGLAEVRIADGRRDDQVDGPSEQRFKGFMQAKVRVGVGSVGERLELDEEVEVAGIWAVASARSGAEQFETPDVERPAQLFELMLAGQDGMHEAFSHATRYPSSG